MQLSQINYPYSMFPSSQNDNLAKVRNKFKATLSIFEQNISNIKNQVTNAKRETNSYKYSDFTIWLNSFESFLLDLGVQIAKLSKKSDFYYEVDYNKLSGWINDFVTILAKELPQNLTNKLEHNFQQNEINNLNQSISIANKEMNDLKKTIENNNIESYQNSNSENQQENIEPCQNFETIRQPDNVEINHLSENQQNQPTGTYISQSLDEILKNLENSLSNAENGTNYYINKNQEEINLPGIINELDIILTNFNTEKQQFSKLKIAKRIQSDELSTVIETIYSRTIQQVNDLKNCLKDLAGNLNYISNNDGKNDAYNRFIEYMKRFLDQIFTTKQDLLGLNLGTNNNNQNENNHKLNASGISMSDVPIRQNTYPFVQENHGQSTRQNTYPFVQENYDQTTRQNTYPFVQETYGQLTHNQQIEELQNANNTLKEEVQNLKKQLNLKNNNEIPKEKIQNLEDQNLQIRKLMNEITSLRAETVKYQSALGNATNFRISDNDPNNVSQLAKDIEELKHLLENFCSFKKSDINYTDFEELLSKYGCSTAGKNLNKNKTLVKGILQRHVIELVIENTNKYFQIEGETEQFLETNQGEKEQSLEIILASVTVKLLNCIESFSTHRIGTDEVTKSAPIKLRQLVYAVLGNRGFSKTLNEGEHPFIIKLRNLIVENLNKYRTIKNPLKIDEIKSDITELIHHIISIFCFRRKIQEPIVEYKWFENAAKVELEFMECPVDEDELDKIMVDICYFPLIGTNLEHDEKYQVITRASVVQTDVNSNN
ncbi:hypothetical protein F8M41_023753 [Gigaspora margarita]|uniref:Uncharacterized protein n=1 Tax=Gigaspora margarita TaxID=4874 RepID=A0A8H4ACT0_GIGMA|nr:hypothetical protein F8M41_023753 [Gigaspora margarita]